VDDWTKRIKYRWGDSRRVVEDVAAPPSTVIAVFLAMPLLLPFAPPDPPRATDALVVTDLLPNGGEVVAGDDAPLVAWNATHGNDTWFWGPLTYSLDGGLTYPYFAGKSVLPMNGTAGRVPRFNTTAARVQVCGFAPDGDSACRQSAGNFTIAATPPYLDLLSPRDGSENVPPRAPLVFGVEGVELTSVWWTVEPFGNLGWTLTWSVDFRILTLDHTLPFFPCTVITVRAGANATDGTPLGPYTWTFMLDCGNQMEIYPPTRLTDPIRVEYRKPMNPSTASWLISPNATLNPSWSDHNRVLLLYPSPSFAPCTSYIFGIRARDLEGNDPPPGPFPNPISFLSNCPLYIVRTYPADGDVDVPLTAPIIIEFSRPFSTPGLSIVINPPVSGLVFTWSSGDTLITISHTPFTPCTTYTVAVLAVELVPGPVPNPWSFTTECVLNPPRALKIERLPPDSVLLTWNPVTNASSYRVYGSADRLAPFPWTIITETSNTSVEFVGDLNDGEDNFYIVRAVWSGKEGPNSTMAAKVERGAQYDAAKTNVHWVSLPFRSEYTRASDIANELTESNIDVIGKWDPATRHSLLWFYFRGAWRGTDFPLVPGEGFFISAVRTFSWPVVGVDPTTPVSFLAHDAPEGSDYGVAFPYASPYGRASDLVLDIEGSLGGDANTRIVEVSAWDGDARILRRFSWTLAGWLGTDFELSSGWAVFIRVVSDFTWQPRLVTPEVP